MARAKVFFKANSIVEEKPSFSWVPLVPGPMTCWKVYSPQLLWTKRNSRHWSRRWRSISSQSRIRSASDTLSAKELSNQLRPLPSLWELFASLPLTVTSQVKSFSKRLCEIAWLVEHAVPLSARSCWPWRALPSPKSVRLLNPWKWQRPTLRLLPALALQPYLQLCNSFQSTSDGEASSPSHICPLKTSNSRATIVEGTTIFPTSANLGMQFPCLQWEAI